MIISSWFNPCYKGKGFCRIGEISNEYQASLKIGKQQKPCETWQKGRLRNVYTN